LPVPAEKITWVSANDREGTAADRACRTKDGKLFHENTRKNQCMIAMRISLKPL